MRFENCRRSTWAKNVCLNNFAQKKLFHGISYGFKPFNLVKFFSNQIDSSKI